jgi:hypothetical protein
MAERQVFISYRRADSVDWVDALHELLAETLGARKVYRDIYSNTPGRDWIKTARTALLTSDAVLALMGENWIGRTVGGQNHINDQQDPVRMEISTAFGRGSPFAAGVAEWSDAPHRQRRAAQRGGNIENPQRRSET